MGPRTRAQLADALARKAVPAEVAESVLRRFEEVDLIDDQEFARQWVASRHVERGLAPRALAHELSRRGVESEVVRDAVAGISPDDELVAARELVRRRLPSMLSDDPARRTRRLASMLARKGYGSGLVYRAIREELADQAVALADQALADQEVDDQEVDDQEVDDQP